MGSFFSSQTAWDENGKVPLNLLLMGKTGHGKSALGNSILGCKAFEVGRNLNSETAEVVCAYSEFKNFSLKVVDGPGLQDTTLSMLKDTERAVRNMNMALTMCCEGVDAFLFVFRVGAVFTPEEVSVLETLKTTFGKDYLKHTIVVLTHGDDIKDKTFDDWCKIQTGPFKQLYEACDRRCVLFNNKETNAEKQIAQREQLTQHAYDLKRRHGCYTADCFKRAASERQRMIITLKHAILKEEIQKQAGIIFSKIDTYCQQPCVTKKAEIERAIGNLKNEIKIEDNGTGVLKELLQIVVALQEQLDNARELHRLTEKMEKTRKAAQIWSGVGM